jgi:hypothetical protein
MAEDTKAAEKETAPKDSMHAGAQAAPAGFNLTSNAATRDLMEQGIIKEAPAPAVEGVHTTETVGEFDPEPGSTLVTDIPGIEETEPVVVNPGNPAPDVVAKQPNETSEEAGERIAAQSKAAESKSTVKAGSK